MEISEQKKIFREEIRKKRRLLTKEEIERESAKALVQLLQTPEYVLCHSIFSYVSYQKELSTFPLIKTAFSDGKFVAVPKVISEYDMEFFKIRNVSELKPGFLGILEPENTKTILYPDKNSIFILPGMLFDKTGRRMGYGGGFYDNYIEKCRQRGNALKLIGYSYDFQLLENEQVPFGEHDQCVDMIVTPSKIIYA